MTSAEKAAKAYGAQFKDGRPFARMPDDAAGDFLNGVRWMQANVKALIGPKHKRNASDREQVRAEFAVEFEREIEQLLR